MEHYRKLFPVTDKWVYLNHAANSPEPLPVLEAMQQYLSACSTMGTVTEESWTSRPTEVRESMAALFGCNVDEVAFVSNVSHAANLVASGLEWHPGDNVVVAKDQFPANIYPWRFLEKRGVEVRYAPWQQSNLAEAVAAMVDKRTRVVAVSWVEFFSGHRHDLATLGRLCRQQDIFLFVDAIQGLGMMAMDVKEMGIDGAAVGGHKWLLGPEGQGAMYISSRWLERLNPPYFSWRSIKDFMNFDNPSPRLRDSAARFEGGTPNFPGIIGLGAGVGLLQQAGLAQVEEKVQALCSRLLAGLGELDVDILTPLDPAQRAGIVSFVPRTKPAGELVADLLEQSIVTCARKNGLRISPHFYNTEEEIDQVLSSLENLLK